MKKYNIRLTISDEAQTIISRYYLKDVTNLHHVIHALTVPMTISDKKLVLVDMVDLDPIDGLMRGMLEYNMYLTSHFLQETSFDACLTTLQRFPDADVHVTLGVHKQRLQLTLIHMIKNGGTPFYQGPFREFSVDKCIKEFQFYFNDNPE